MKCSWKLVVTLVLVSLLSVAVEGQRKSTGRKSSSNSNNSKQGNAKKSSSSSSNSKPSANGNSNKASSTSTSTSTAEGPPGCRTKECRLLMSELERLKGVLAAQEAALATAAPITQAPPALPPVTKPKTKKTPKPVPSTTPAPPPPPPPPTPPPSVEPEPQKQQPSAEPVAAPVVEGTAPAEASAPAAEAAVEALLGSVALDANQVSPAADPNAAVLENAPSIGGNVEPPANGNPQTASEVPPSAAEPVSTSVSVAAVSESTTVSTTTTKRVRTTTPKPVDPCPKERDIAPCLCSVATPPEHLPTMDCSPAVTLRNLAIMSGKKVEGRLFKRIILQNTDIESLPRAAFGPHKAEEYWITNNLRLSRIDRGAFGEANPSSLVLNNNALVNFPWQDLRGFTKLEYFIAYENQLNSVPDRAFSGLSPKIVDILLHNNSIQNVGEFPFSRLPALNAITLHNNLISEVQTHSFHFDSAPNILTLQNNFIKSIENDAFGRATPLYTNLANNLLEFMERELWFPYLVNVAAAAGRATPEKQVAVDMTGNPVLCEKCENFWLWQNKRRFQNAVVGLSCIDTITASNFFDLERWFFRQCF